MSELKSVLLLHEGYGHPHLDWLLESPKDSGYPSESDRALTFKLPWPFPWSEHGQAKVQLNFPHRHHYFEYEGEVSGDRGRVRQIHCGTHQPSQWTETEIKTRMRLDDLMLEIDLKSVDAKLWILEWHNLQIED